ncbi:MAG: hypothetical protein LUQ07_01085 [Methanospirillum sp.]|nr:hypothetical protein [Methanospirillum sp.]
MDRRVHLDEIRTILLEERDSGTLSTIPHDLFERTGKEIQALQQQLYAMEDPFSDEAQILIEQVSSSRSTVEDLFKTRIEKVVALAESQADGSYIEREELKVLIPAELEMFNRIVESIRKCHASLIDWRTSVAPRLAEPQADSSLHGQEDIFDAEEAERAEETPAAVIERKTPAEQPFTYNIVQALSSMEPFMGIDGRTYELAAGDILTLPSRNAQVLAERDIVLNINPG